MNYIKTVDEVFRQFSGVNFQIKFWDGTEIVYGDKTQPIFTLIFHTENSVKRLLGEGSLAFFVVSLSISCVYTHGPNWSVVAVSAVLTIVEMLCGGGVDNLVLPIVASVLYLLCFVS